MLQVLVVYSLMEKIIPHERIYNVAYKFCKIAAIRMHGSYIYKFIHVYVYDRVYYTDVQLEKVEKSSIKKMQDIL